MHITQLRLKNIGPFADLKLDLTRGSIGIFGKNGSGKSTLLNAMYALVTNDFGRFPGLKIDCTRNTCEKKDESFVQGTVVHGQHSMNITRKIRGKPNSSLVVDGGDEIADANKVEEKITETLGISPDLIKLYVFKPQDQIYDFISTTNSVRAKAFAVLCRTEKCEAIWNNLNTFLNKDSEVNAQITDNSDELLTEIGDHESQVASYREEITSQQATLLNAKSEDSAKEILRKHESLAGLHRQREKEEGRLQDAETEIKELEARIEKRKAKVASYTKLVDDNREAAEETRASLKSWATYQTYRSKRRQLREEKDELVGEDARQQAPVPPKSMAGAKPVETLKQEQRDMATRLKDAEVAVKMFDTAGQVKCPTCKTPVSELHDHLEAMRAAAKLLPGQIKALATTIDEIEEYQAELRIYQKWRQSYDSRVQSNKAALEALGDMKAPEGDREQLKKFLGEHEAAVKELEEFKEKLAASREAVAKSRANREQAARRIGEIDAEIQECTQPEERVEKATRRLKEHAAAQVTIGRLEGLIQGLEKHKAAKEAELSKLKARLKRTKKVRRLAAVVARVRDAMHRDALPRRVARANLSRMEGGINENLGHFGDPFWVESSETLDFIAHKPGEPEQPASWLSTGQRVVLAISFWPAVASLWATDLGMLALDEPTANLDEDNRKFLQQALGNLTAQVRGHRQLIMVTHDPNLRTAFDQVIDLSEV